MAHWSHSDAAERQNVKLLFNNRVGWALRDAADCTHVCTTIAKIGIDNIG